MDPTSLGLFLFFVLLYPILVVAIFVHELGHALSGWLVGCSVYSFGVGVGKPWFVGRVGRTRIFFCLSGSNVGVTFASWPQVFPAQWRMVTHFGAGVLANVVCILLASLLLVLGPGYLPVVVVAAVTLFWNAVLVLGSLWPARMRLGKAVIHNDMSRVLHLLRHGTTGATITQRLQAARGLRGLLLAIRDDATLFHCLLDDTLAWLELGNTTRAGRSFEEAELLAWEPAPITQALHALVGSILARQSGDPARAESQRAEAEKLYRELGDTGGLLLVAWGRGVDQGMSGDLSGALARFEELAAHPLVVARPKLALDLLADRLGLQLANGVVDADAWQKYLAHSGDFEMRPASLRLHTLRARLHEQRGQDVDAEADFRHALAIARALHEEMTHADDRSDFLVCQADLLAAARTCLQRLGKTVEAAEVEIAVPPALHAARRARRDTRPQSSCDCHPPGHLQLSGSLGSVGLGVLS